MTATRPPCARLACGGGGGARWSVAMLWRGYRLALRGPVFHPGRTGTGGNWAAKEDWLYHLDTLLDTDAAA